MKIYIAEFRYGKPNLAEFDAVEKPKSYFTTNRREIIGSIWSERHIKGDKSVHLTLNDALFYLEKRAADVLKQTREKLVEAEREYNVLFDIANAIRRDPDCAVKAIADLTAK